VIGNNNERAATGQAIAKFRKGALQSNEFIVDANSHCLKQSREVGRTCCRAQRRPDGVDQIIADRKRLR